MRVPREKVRFQRKSNSGNLNGRKWRSRYGVLTAAIHDTYFRARLQAWIDLLKICWLDSSNRGVAKPGYRAAFGAPRSPVQIRPPRLDGADLRD